MDALLAGLYVFITAQFGLIWYRLGRIEQRCKNGCPRAESPKKK